MAGFGDLSVAAAMRDTIERIAGGVVTAMRPEPFLAKVYSIDLNNQRAQVVPAGQTSANLLTVSFALDKIPQVVMSDNPSLGEDAPADIVRVMRSGGSFFVLDYFSGSPIPLSPLDLSVLNENPSFENLSWEGGFPVGWQNYNSVALPAMSLIDDDVIDGNFALRIQRVASGGVSIRLQSSDTFAVVPGETIIVGGWFKELTVSGVIVSLGIVSGTTAGVNIFSGGTTLIQSVTVLAEGVWKYIEASFVIPATHTFCRIDTPLWHLSDVTMDIRVDKLEVRRRGFTPWISIDGTTSGATNLFTNGWVNYGSGEQTAQFRKVDDEVQCRGLIKNGTGTMFTLPVGYRPPMEMIFTSQGTSTGPVDAAVRIDVGANGTVVLMQGVNTYQNLNGIRFSTTP